MSLVRVQHHAAKFFMASHLIVVTYLIQVQCQFFAMPCQMLHATKFYATPHPILHAARFYTTPRTILHATKFLATPHLILDATKSFATPCLFFKTLFLILGTLLHVLKMMAIKSQDLISNTSAVVDAKVITTGETTTPSLLDNVFPSINDFFAGDSHACDLLQAQLATLQCILHESVDLDDLPL